MQQKLVKIEWKHKMATKVRLVINKINIDKQREKITTIYVSILFNYHNNFSKYWVS